MRPSNVGSFTGLPATENSPPFRTCLAWQGHRAAMSAPRAAAQFLRMSVSLGYSFRPLLRGRGRRSAPSLLSFGLTALSFSAHSPCSRPSRQVSVHQRLKNLCGLCVPLRQMNPFTAGLDRHESPPVARRVEAQPNKAGSAPARTNKCARRAPWGFSPAACSHRRRAARSRQ